MIRKDIKHHLDGIKQMFETFDGVHYAKKLGFDSYVKNNKTYKVSDYDEIVRKTHESFDWLVSMYDTGHLNNDEIKELNKLYENWYGESIEVV